MRYDHFVNVETICRALLDHSHARGVWLVSRAGETLAILGDVAFSVDLLLDPPAQLGSERECYVPIDGEPKRWLHVSLVGERWLLAVVFDTRSSLGLVRLRAKQARERLALALQ